MRWQIYSGTETGYVWYVVAGVGRSGSTFSIWELSMIVNLIEIIELSYRPSNKFSSSKQKLLSNFGFGRSASACARLRGTIEA